MQLLRGGHVRELIKLLVSLIVTDITLIKSKISDSHLPRQSRYPRYIKRVKSQDYEESLESLVNNCRMDTPSDNILPELGGRKLLKMSPKYDSRSFSDIETGDISGFHYFTICRYFVIVCPFRFGPSNATKYVCRSCLKVSVNKVMYVFSSIPVELLSKFLFLGNVLSHPSIIRMSRKNEKYSSNVLTTTGMKGIYLICDNATAHNGD